jgi:hypothetical protein
MPKKHNSQHRVGEIGEAAFLLTATQRGLLVSKPFGDKESYDFIVDNGTRRLRVQVKTTGKRASRASYHVTIARGTAKSTPYKKRDLDFLVIHVLPERIFYILPHKALAGRVALSVPSSRRKKPSPFAQHRERWDLLLGTNDARANDSRRNDPPQTIQAAADPNYAAPKSPECPIQARFWLKWGFAPVPDAPVKSLS